MREITSPTQIGNATATRALHTQLASRVAHSQAPYLAVVLAANLVIADQLSELARAGELANVAELRRRCGEMIDDAVASGIRSVGENN